MKRLLKVVAALCLSLSLVACGGGNSSEGEAKATVDNFFNALHEGDVEKAQSFASQTVIDDLNEMTDSLESMNSVLDEMNASDETREKFHSILTTVIKGVFEKHEISNTEKVSDTEYVFTVKNNGISVDDLQDIGSALDTGSFMDDIISDYTQMLLDNGEEEANKWLIDQLGTELSTTVTDYVKDAKREENEMHCTVVKDGDKWIVDNMQ